MSKQTWLRVAGAMVLTLGMLGATGCSGAKSQEPQPVKSTEHYSQDPQESFVRLVEGNNRMSTAQLNGAELHHELIKARAQGQKPYAAIVGCSDSRSGPEIIFDAGYSELFVCRLAGYVASSQVRASVEYAGKVLGTKLVVVLGHTRCGAVDASVKDLSVSRDITLLVDELSPGVKIARAENWPKEQLTARAEVVNAYLQKARLLKHSEYLKQQHDAGTIKIVVGVQDLATGKIAWLDTDGLTGVQITQGKLYEAPSKAAMEGLVVK
jgi:carbonic anhydrase